MTTSEADDQRRREAKPAGASEGVADSHEKRGAESYGGDPDSGPSVTDEEIKRGFERDQAEG